MAALQADRLDLVHVVVPESAQRSPGRFDVIGALGLAFGLVALLLPVSKAPTGAGEAPPRCTFHREIIGHSGAHNAEVLLHQIPPEGGEVGGGGVLYLRASRPLEESPESAVSEGRSCADHPRRQP